MPRQRGLPTGHPAAVFPALDRIGNITYFQARFIDPTCAGQKYGNPLGRLASNPGLAWTQAVGTTRRDLPLVITEGVPDALVLAGYRIRSVAVLGTATGHRHMVDQLKCEVEQGDVPAGIAVCLDADTAGRSAAALLTEQLGANGVGVVNVVPTNSMDITDWVIDRSGLGSALVLCRRDDQYRGPRAASSQRDGT